MLNSNLTHYNKKKKKKVLMISNYMVSNFVNLCHI